MTDAHEHLLRDGRVLAYHEYGAADGIPCVYLPGTTVSGVMGEVYDRAAAAAGVRWVSVDRPGFGASDPHPARSIDSLADDVLSLASSLRFDRFAVVAESGGTAYALALALRAPNRLLMLGIVAGLGPLDAPQGRQGLPANSRMLFLLGRRAPALLIPFMALLRAGHRAPAENRLSRPLPAGLPARDAAALSDRRMRQICDSAIVDGLRQGPRSPAHELVLMARPWGLDLSRVTVPIAMWHGAQDRTVPLHLAQRLATQLPRVEVCVVADAGHAVGLSSAQQVMTAIRNTAS